MRQAGPRCANLGIKGPAGADAYVGDKSAVRLCWRNNLRSVYAIVMATWLRMLTVVGLLLGKTDYQMTVIRCYVQHSIFHG